MTGRRRHVDGGALLRQTISYLLTLALLLIAIQAMGTLFFAHGAGNLVILCLAAALIAAPLLATPLSDWTCWLIVQAIAVLAAARFAGAPATLLPALAKLQGNGLTFNVPALGPLQGGTLTLSQQSAVWTLLLLLGLLTWELVWGVLWLTLRAGYLWAAIMMAGATLLTAASVSRELGGRVPVFLLVALLLVLWHTWSGRWLRAARQAPALQPRGGASLSLLGGLCALVTLPIAWSVAPLPARALNAIDPRSLTQLLSRIQDPFQTLNTSGTSLTAAGFGTALRLNGPFHPFQGTVMRIDGVPPDLHPYWRGLIYDRYTADGWQADPIATQQAPPGAPIAADVPRHPARWIGVAVQVVHAATGMLFAPGRPVAADLATRSAYAVGGEGLEPTAVYAAGGLSDGARYRITAELPATAPDPGAPGPLPDPRFTALPATLDPAIVALARRLTAGLPSAFDRARAIERYLRGAPFVYDTTVGAPPAGANALSYFLFDSHRGYCVHFASAMAVLARAARLPARVAGGYVTGSRQGGSWLVQGADAHTWTEIFFQGTGWVPFEPTPGFGDVAQPIGVRQTQPGGAVTRPAATATAAPVRQSRGATVAVTARGAVPRDSSFPWLPLGLAVLLAALGGGVLGAMYRARREPSIEQVYRRMCRAARRLAVAPRVSQTPNEFARAFAGRSPAEHADVTRITALYVEACYGGATPTPREVYRALLALRRLRRRWLRRRLAPWREA